MRAPLEVTVYDGRRYHRVTAQTHGLSFTKSAPGGNRQASCELWVPPGRFHDLGPADVLMVDDARTAARVWDGYTNNPGEKAGPGGVGFELSALGGMVLAADRAERSIFRDTNLDSWEPSVISGSTADATVDVGNFPSDAGTRAGDPALFMQFPRGMVTPSGGSTASFWYDKFRGTTQAIGAVTFFQDGGATHADYIRQAGHLPVPVAGFSFFSGALSTTGSTQTYIASSHLMDYVLSLVLNSADAVTIPNDNIWWAVGEVAVLGQMVDRFGDWYVNPRTSHVLASEVAADLLGRILTMCDPASADIEASTFPIDSLAYIEAVTSATILDDLLKFEPDFDWGIGCMLPNGKHRFWFRQWPTTPRYVLTDDDEVSLPGSDDTLCNRIAVEWADEKGKPQTASVEVTVPELGTRIKDAEKITLPEGQGSLANAVQVGTAVLEQANARKFAGTATVRRKLLDLHTGQEVGPWGIEPGAPVRLQSKGVDVRLTEMTYNDDDCSAALTLNTPQRSTDDIIAHLPRR